MEVQREAFNMTESFSLRYPVANMIFPNKTVILVTSKHHNTISTNQQMALLAAMAFIGGIVVGLLFRFIYFGIVNYFIKNMDQITSVQRPEQGNTNVAYVDDNFRPPHDEPPDYVTVVTTESSTNTFRVMNKTAESKDTEDGPPPTYISIVSNVGRVVRSAST